MKIKEDEVVEKWVNRLFISAIIIICELTLLAFLMIIMGTG